MIKQLYLLLIFCAVFATACSEESAIEGLIPQKSSVTAINADIAAGSNKTIALTVNNQTLNVHIVNSSTTSNGFESRDCTISMLNNAAVFTLAASSAYISTAEAGAEISASAFSSPSYSGALYFATKPVNNTVYNYVNTNGVRFGNSYYVPFKVVPGNGQSVPVYAYLQLSVSAEKVVLHKMVYRNTGSLSAGGE